VECLKFRTSNCAPTSPLGVPKFVQTDKAIAAMLRLCTEMPSMKWCSDCTSNQDPSKNCKDALVSLSSLCQDHYMRDCNEWYTRKDLSRQISCALKHARMWTYFDMCMLVFYTCAHVINTHIYMHIQTPCSHATVRVCVCVCARAHTHTRTHTHTHTHTHMIPQARHV
jgi:hypothetical protein